MTARTHDFLVLRLFFLVFAARFFQFSQKIVRIARRSPSILRRARLDLLSYRGVLHFEVVFKIVNVQTKHY